MSQESHVLSLAVMAQCFDVRVTWLEEVYELGLLGTGKRQGSAIVVSTRQLEVVAEVIRLHYHQGVDLPGIALWLARREAAATRR